MSLVVTKHLACSSTLKEHIIDGWKDNLKLESDKGGTVTILMEAFLISGTFLYRTGVCDKIVNRTVHHWFLLQGRSEEGELFKPNALGATLVLSTWAKFYSTMTIFTCPPVATFCFFI